MVDTRKYGAVDRRGFAAGIADMFGGLAGSQSIHKHSPSHTFSSRQSLTPSNIQDYRTHALTQFVTVHPPSLKPPVPYSLCHELHLF